jgi:hypothetical protein
VVVDVLVVLKSWDALLLFKLGMIQVSFDIIILCFICHCSLSSIEDCISCHLLFHVAAHFKWIL